MIRTSSSLQIDLVNERSYGREPCCHSPSCLQFIAAIVGLNFPGAGNNNRLREDADIRSDEALICHSKGVNGVVVKKNWIVVN